MAKETGRKIVAQNKKVPLTPIEQTLQMTPGPSTGPDAVAKADPDLVICGMASTDGTMGVLPAILAERLGVPRGRVHQLPGWPAEELGDVHALVGLASAAHVAGEEVVEGAAVRAWEVSAGHRSSVPGVAWSPHALLALGRHLHRSSCRGGHRPARRREALARLAAGVGEAVRPLTAPLEPSARPMPASGNA